MSIILIRHGETAFNVARVFATLDHLSYGRTAWIARMFDMECAYPVPMPLVTYMADKGPLWNSMVARYSLQPIAYEKVASWRFGDFIFNSGFDNISSTIKARRAGFQACIDTEEMFETQFRHLRAEQIIPPLG